MIWLVGCLGMLGSEIASQLEECGLPWVGSDREVDITNKDALKSFAADKGISCIINCAAYTDVDKAEDEPELCAAINCEGPANIGALASESDAVVVHISTDYVFDGSLTRPYQEDDPVSPLSVYGATKARGEAALKEFCPRSYIIRTAWLYGTKGRNFVLTMARLMKDQVDINVVADQRGSPTNSADFARALLSMIQSKKDDYGIYHYSNSGDTTWYEFATLIHDQALKNGVLKRACNIHPIATVQYPTKASRPTYSVLSKAKIKRIFGIVPPAWQESLVRFIANLDRG